MGTHSPADRSSIEAARAWAYGLLHGDMREKRRRLMADWAAYCKSSPAAAMDNVVPMSA
jgi:hypothetical protein